MTKVMTQISWKMLICSEMNKNKFFQARFKRNENNTKILLIQNVQTCVAALTLKSSLHKDLFSFFFGKCRNEKLTGLT